MRQEDVPTCDNAAEHYRVQRRFAPVNANEKVVSRDFDAIRALDLINATINAHNMRLGHFHHVERKFQGRVCVDLDGDSTLDNTHFDGVDTSEVLRLPAVWINGYAWKAVDAKSAMCSGCVPLIGRIQRFAYPEAIADLQSDQPKFIHVGEVPPIGAYAPSAAGAASAKAIDADVVERWLIDTGCGHDLVAYEDVRPFKQVLRRPKVPLGFHTANGPTNTKYTVKVMVRELADSSVVNVLKDTPAVLSVGRRCMKEGYSFHWPAGSPPFFITPDNVRVMLEVDDDVPYLRPGSDCRHPVNDGDTGAAYAAAPTPNRPEAAQPANVPDWDIVQPDEEEEVQYDIFADEAVDEAAPPGDDGDNVAEPPNEDDDADDAEVGRFPADPEEVIEPADGEVDPDDFFVTKLREQAASIKHLLTHKPFNRYCDACVQGKLKMRPHRRGAYRRKPKKWGDIVTGDHLVGNRGAWTGVTGDENAFTIRDLWSGYLACYPVKAKDTPCAVESLKHFMGARKIRLFYSDNSQELIGATEELGIDREGTEVGDPTNNAIAERNNQTILGGVRSILIRAGFPACFWPFAAPYYCLMDNVDVGANQQKSPYHLVHKEEFKGQLIPFGSRVYFKPLAVRVDHEPPTKWEGTGEPGVFMGYETLKGGKWSGNYLV